MKDKGINLLVGFKNNENLDISHFKIKKYLTRRMAGSFYMNWNSYETEL
jgi:hypothetical protein